MFATPEDAITAHTMMVAAGVDIPDLVIRVNSLYTNGVWSEPIPVVDGWTVVEPTTDATMSCGVNLATQTFAPVTTKEVLPALYIDVVVPPAETPAPTPAGATCESATAILAGEACVE